MIRAAVAAALLTSANTVLAEDPRFDPLSRDELRHVVDLLVESGRTSPDTRIARVSRLATGKSASPQRRARVVALLAGKTTEIDVDLDREALTFTEVSQGYAPITSNDWKRANEVLRDDPRWIAAMAARGIKDVEDVFCESLSAGYFAATASAEARVIRLPCYETSAATTNIYGRPIEGLVATVSLDTWEVIELLDEGVTPLPAPAAQLPVAVGAATVAPDPDLSFAGRRIAYGPWSVHAALDDQFGLTLSDLTFFDGVDARQILHQGHVAEVYVPYLDPKESWGFRSYLDAGEFGLGTLVSPLVPGVDCPASAVFIESHHLTATARIVSHPRAICVFTEPLPGPVWRHYEAFNDLSAGAAGRVLVIRSISSIAHYDYIFDWVFEPSGAFEIRIGATGIDAVKAMAGEDNASEGNRVTPDLIAVFHDHFFSLRLDLDIDGPLNRLVREDFVVETSRKNPLSRSYWHMRSQTVDAEGPLATMAPGIWRLESSDRLGVFGEPTGYQIMPEGTVSLLSPDDSPQRRGAFSAAPLWVTRHKIDEKAASGDYPNQHPGDAGLPAFTDGEPVIDTDLVLWPTIGFRHVTRVEDWPALSTVWKSVRLKPYGFFAQNPSILK